ncbi:MULTISPECIES: hypothetical protein [unclassified Pedobacter]|uniref:hypothetical protein n=1 Tax=unclassified Pedobacter TaxID=2628915 RepID=UPI00141F86FD|nr:MULTISPECIES: hypothetical protein [unclassified Pedobacter]NII81750.1 hypothetical protein [Pedobacter sp. SG908]
MEEKDILQNITDTLIEKSVYTLKVPIKHPMPVPKRAIIDKILRKPIVVPETVREFNITPCIVGNMYRIAGRAVKLPGEILEGSMAGSLLPIINEHLSDLVYIVAAGIQNTKFEPEPDLIEFIEDNFEAEDLYQALLPILENLGMQSFLNSIALAKGTVKILKPNVSPIDGSELIASHTLE